MIATRAPESRVVLCADESELGKLARQWAEQCAREVGGGLLRLRGSLARPAVTLSLVHPGDLLVLGFADGQGRVSHAVVDFVGAAPLPHGCDPSGRRLFPGTSHGCADVGRKAPENLMSKMYWESP